MFSFNEKKIIYHVVALLMQLGLRACFGRVYIMKMVILEMQVNVPITTRGYTLILVMTVFMKSLYISTRWSRTWEVVIKKW